jgi:hypothetical protein
MFSQKRKTDFFIKKDFSLPGGMPRRPNNIGLHGPT